MSNNRSSQGASNLAQPAAHFSPLDPHELAKTFLKKQFHDSCHHVTLRFWRDEFHRFRDGRYWPISSTEVRAHLTEFIRKQIRDLRFTKKDGEFYPVTTGMVNNTMQALVGRTLVASETESPAWLGDRAGGPFLAFRNGLVPYDESSGAPLANLGGLRHHCAQWFSRTAFPFEYDPAATCPRWLAFLEEVLEGDAERIALLQEWFGYCLLPDTSQQSFMVMIGEGQNGKSVALDVLAAMLGSDNVSHVPVEAFDQRFQLTATLGKLANISFDTGSIKESAEATIKEFTGGDRMYFDRKGIPGVMAKPTARLILATNQDPRFGDRSRGIWRRMIPMPFRVTIPAAKRNPRLADSLKEELSGIFNWASSGLSEVRRRGHFVVPQVCQEALLRFQSESNPARQFLQEAYETGTASDSVGCKDVFAAYTEWCHASGLRVLDVTNFGKELHKVFPSAERFRESTGRRDYRYRALRAFSGVAHQIGYATEAADTHAQEGNDVLQ